MTDEHSEPPALPKPAEPDRRVIEAVSTELSTGALVIYHPEREHHFGEVIQSSVHIPISATR